MAAWSFVFSQIVSNLYGDTGKMSLYKVQISFRAGFEHHTHQRFELSKLLENIHKNSILLAREFFSNQKIHFFGCVKKT